MYRIYIYIYISKYNSGELIHLVNTGTLPLRVRDTNKAEIGAKLQSARAKILEMIRSTSSSYMSDFAIYTVQCYKDKFDGRHPEDDGHVLFDKSLDGKMESVCVVRVQQKGEWRMENKDKVSSKLTEIVDDGTTNIRANQMDAKFEALNREVDFTKGADIKSQLVIDHTTAVVEDEQDGEGNEADGSDDEFCDEDPENTFLGAALGVVTAQKVKAKPKPKSAAVAIKSKGLGSSGSGDGASPRIVKTILKAAAVTPTKAGKGANGATPTRNPKKPIKPDGLAIVVDDDMDDNDIADYLATEKKPELEKSFEKAIMETSAAPLNDVPMGDAAAKAVRGRCVQLSNVLKGLHTEAIAMFWKVKKRKSHPKAAVEILQVLRDDIQNFWSLVLSFTVAEKDFDIEKSMRLFAYCRDRQHQIPVALCVTHYRLRLLDLVHYSQFDEFGRSMNEASVAGALLECDAKQDLDLYVAEDSLKRVWSDVKGRNDEKDLLAVGKSVEVMRKLQAVDIKRGIPGLADLPILITALDIEADNVEFDQSAALETLRKKMQDPHCEGIVKAFQHCSASQDILKYIDLVIANKKKGSQNKNLIAKVGGLCDKLKNYEKYVDKDVVADISSAMTSLVSQLHLAGASLPEKDEADFMLLFTHMGATLDSLLTRSKQLAKEFSVSICSIADKAHLDDLKQCQENGDALFDLRRRADAMGFAKLGVSGGGGGGSSVMQALFGVDAEAMLATHLENIAAINASSAFAFQSLDMARALHALPDASDEGQLAPALALRATLLAASSRMKGEQLEQSNGLLAHFEKLQNLEQSSRSQFIVRRNEFKDILSTALEQITSKTSAAQPIADAASAYLKKINEKITIVCINCNS
jgi:hypothetical protein